MAKGPNRPSGDRVIQSGKVNRPITPVSIHEFEGKLIFFYEWCKKCRICAAICPTKALETDEEGKPYMAHEDKCTLCSLCWRICPDFAIIKNYNWEGTKDAVTKNHS